MTNGMQSMIEKATDLDWADIVADLAENATIFNTEIEPGEWPTATMLADFWIDGAAGIEDVEWDNLWTPTIIAACDEVLTRLMYPAPTEDDWGFYGVLPRNLEGQTIPVDLNEEEMTGFWYIACRAVAETFGEHDPAVVRNFLRSRYGRHLADMTTDHWLHGENLDEAIRLAVTMRRRGRLDWQTPFNEIRKATLDGSWTD